MLGGCEPSVADPTEPGGEKLSGERSPPSSFIWKDKLKTKFIAVLHSANILTMRALTDWLKLTDSLTHSLTYSFTPSLPHLLIYSLIYSLTH